MTPGHPSAATYRGLATEQPNPSSRGLDRRSVPAILRIINREDRRVPAAVAAQRAPLARAVELVIAALETGGRLHFVGAGTSGRLGVLEAAECPPTFGTPPGLVRAVMAGGRGAVFRPVEGAEDDAAEGARSVRRGARRGDVVVGVAASGVTPFVRGALRAARALGCRTVLVTCRLRAWGREADVTVAPAVGPEVVAGSTRLKSGTAAKLVLNALTTAAMVRLGKVHDHWMVDLRPTNRKLRNRAARIVAELGGAGPARAAKLLAACGGEVKTAVVAARAGLSPQAARRLLTRCGGRLRRALEGGG